MSLGFVRRVAANGGGGGARPVARPTWTTGRRGPSIPRTVARTVARAIPATPRSVVGDPRAMPPQVPGLTRESIPYYDPARVVDLDKLKVVKDLREPRTAPEFAEERGDVTSGDTGGTGPGSGTGTFPTRAKPTTAPILGKQGTGLALAALAAFLLLRGA